MNTARKIVRNVFSNWASQLVTVIVTFFLTPFVVHSLGDDSYGIWVLAFSLTGHLGILDLGLRPIIVKYVSKFDALGDTDQINEVINTTLSTFVILGSIAFVVSLGLAYFSDHLFNVPPDKHFELRAIIALAGVNVALGFPFGVFNAITAAFQRFDLSSVVKTAVFLARSLCIVIFLSSGGELLTLGVIITVAQIAEFVWRIQICYKIFPQLKIRLGYINRETLKMVSGFGIYGFIIALSSRIAYRTDSIVIGAFVTASAITYFSIGATLIEYLQNVVSLIVVTITPVAASFEARQEFDKLRSLLVLSTKYCSLVVLPIGVTYIFLGEQFITLWMGPEYGPLSSKVLMILMIGYFAFLSQLGILSIFYGLGKVKFYALMSLTMAAVNLGLSILLVNILEGDEARLLGVAWGTTLPLSIYAYILQPAYICKQVGLRFTEYFRTAYTRPVLAILPFLAIIWIVRYTIDFVSLFQFFAVIAAACVVYLICTFFVALEPDHRKMLVGRIKALLDKNGNRGM